MKELIAIQNELKVLKDQSKNGIQFKYRTCEQIFQEVKPLCKEHGVLLVVSDEAVCIGERYYIKATAAVMKDNIEISASGLAREPDKLMSMSFPQITGSCSSYARKTAMGGLFNLDDNSDPDSGKGNDEEPKALASVEQIKILKEYMISFESQGKTKFSDAIAEYLDNPLTEKDADDYIKRAKAHSGEA